MRSQTRMIKTTMIWGTTEGLINKKRRIGGKRIREQQEKSREIMQVASQAKEGQTMQAEMTSEAQGSGANLTNEQRRDLLHPGSKTNNTEGFKCVWEQRCRESQIGVETQFARRKKKMRMQEETHRDRRTKQATPS